MKVQSRKAKGVIAHSKTEPGRGNPSLLKSIPRAFLPDDVTLHKQKQHRVTTAKVRVRGQEAHKEISTK